MQSADEARLAIEHGASAVKIAPEVDAILLDSGNPSLQIKELGGTGRVHDWSISRRIREAVGVPIFLAGGLRVENVGAAIESVRPYAVDVCTGLRTDGALDPVKLERFVTAVRAAA
jgi:phosphoribosylanthranilate isomerase